MIKKGIFFLLLFCAGTTLSFGQDQLIEKIKWPFLQKILNPPEDKPPRKVGFAPLPYLEYAPETGIGFGIFTQLYLRMWADSITRVSTAEAEFVYSLKNQMIVRAAWNLFPRGERYNIKGNISYRIFPEYWWGIGNEVPESNRELYDARRIEGDFNVLRKVSPGVFIGLSYQFQYMYGIEGEPGSMIETGEIVGNEGGLSSGLGPTFILDQRQNLLNPQKGWYFSLINTNFYPTLGSDFSFSRFEVDVRHYLPILPKKEHILAMQFFGQMQTGEPPFRLLSLMGGSRLMRGYYTGRYRDQHYAAFQAEYRALIWWRIGLTAFAAVGDVFKYPENWNARSLKYSFGGGVRFKFSRKDNINIRFDAAWGRETRAIYLGFGEAF